MCRASPRRRAGAPALRSRRARCPAAGRAPCWPWARRAAPAAPRSCRCRHPTAPAHRRGAPAPTAARAHRGTSATTGSARRSPSPRRGRAVRPAPRASGRRGSTRNRAGDCCHRRDRTAPRSRRSARQPAARCRTCVPMPARPRLWAATCVRAGRASATAFVTMGRQGEARSCSREWRAKPRRGPMVGGPTAGRRPIDWSSGGRGPALRGLAVSSPTFHAWSP